MKKSVDYLDEGLFAQGLNAPTRAIAEMLEAEKYFFEKYVQTHDTVLDIGTGTGRTADYLAKKGSRVLSIDISPSALAQSKKVREQHTNISMIVADATLLPFANKICDISIFGLCTLGTLTEDDQRRVLQEAQRVTKRSLLGSVYAKNAAPYQQEWYESVGVEISSVDEQFVYVDSLGFRSQRFSRKSLSQLLSRYARDYTIFPISDIALGYEVNC